MRIGLDLDGTLVTCEPRHSALMLACCRAHGRTFDREAYWNLRRHGANNRVALKRLGLHDTLVVSATAEWERAIEEPQWLRLDSLFDGVLHTLARWRREGHSLHLVSARRLAAFGYSQLAQLSLRDHFDSVDFVSSGAKDIALSSRRLSLYIGDTEVDLQASRCAGIKSVLVSSGMRDAQFLARHLPDAIVQSITDITLGATS